MIVGARRARRAAILLCVSAVWSGACRTAEPPDGGIRIGDKTLAQFQPNDTSKHWLISIIGPPTSSTSVSGLDESVEILRYSTIERPPAGFLTLFTGSAPPKTTATIYFVVRSGIVTQFWADREESSTLLGKEEKDTGEKRSE